MEGVAIKIVIYQMLVLGQYIDITIHVHRVIYLLDTRIDTALLHMDTLFRQCKEMFWANNTLLLSVGHNITALLGSCG